MIGISHRLNNTGQKRLCSDPVMRSGYLLGRQTCKWIFVWPKICYIDRWLFIVLHLKSEPVHWSAMVKCWNIFLAARGYTIEHRSSNRISHSDFLSRCCIIELPRNLSGLLMQPWPWSNAYANILQKTLGKACWPDICRKFPVLYAEIEEVSMIPDGMLCTNYPIMIPSKLKRTVPQNLHW